MKLSRFITFLDQSSNHAASSVMLIQSVRELLSHSLQMLSQCVCFQHQGIPFILEERKQAWDTSGSRRAGLHSLVSCGKERKALRTNGMCRTSCDPIPDFSLTTGISNVHIKGREVDKIEWGDATEMDMSRCLWQRCFP